MKAYRNILAVLLAIVISFSFPCISFALDDTAVQEIEAKTVEERAEEILSSMTLEEKVAQMFMVYMPSKKATFKRNINSAVTYYLQIILKTIRIRKNKAKSKLIKKLQN